MYYNFPGYEPVTQRTFTAVLPNRYPLLRDLAERSLKYGKLLIPLMCTICLKPKRICKQEVSLWYYKLYTNSVVAVIIVFDSSLLKKICVDIPQSCKNLKINLIP